MCQSLWQNSFLDSLQNGKISSNSMLLCIRNEQYDGILAHLRRKLRGDLLVYQRLRRPSIVRLSVNIFKHLLLNRWSN